MLTRKFINEMIVKIFQWSSEKQENILTTFQRNFWKREIWSGLMMNGWRNIHSEKPSKGTRTSSPRWNSVVTWVSHNQKYYFNTLYVSVRANVPVGPCLSLSMFTGHKDIAFFKAEHLWLFLLKWKAKTVSLKPTKSSW